MIAPGALVGTIPMLATPFDAAGSVDEVGLRRIAEHIIASGARALAVGGLAAEAHALSIDERKLVTEVVLDQVAGRVGVLVTATSESTVLAVDLGRHAAAAGAEAVMLAPPWVTKTTTERLYRHYCTFAESVDAPVMVQEAPAYVGASLGFERISRLVARCANVMYLKIEAVPLASAIANAREALGTSVRIFTGSGGLHLLDAYAAGADGSIPGCDIPEVLVAIDHAIARGDHPEAARLYHAALPLLVAENQTLDILIAASKRILVERGVIRHAGMRAPAGIADDVTEPSLDAYRTLAANLPDLLVNATVDTTKVESQR